MAVMAVDADAPAAVDLSSGQRHPDSLSYAGWVNAS